MGASYLGYWVLSTVYSVQGTGHRVQGTCLCEKRAMGPMTDSKTRNHMKVPLDVGICICTPSPYISSYKKNPKILSPQKFLAPENSQNFSVSEDRWVVLNPDAKVRILVEE